MKAVIPARYQACARVIKALGHPTRLFLVDQLSKGEGCVCKLTAMVGDDVSTVSRHLSLLKSAGIVVTEKRGNQVFYRLRTLCVLGFFDCIAAVMQSRVKEERAALARR